jgi:GGDEF domain-containing protein
MEGPPLARVRSSPSDTSRDVAIGDWDVLLDAVKERLRSAVGGCPAPTLTATPCNGRPVHDTVVECALILDQLHLTMAREMGRLQPYDGATAEALLRKADAAMYAAKREQTRHAFVQPD